MRFNGHFWLPGWRRIDRLSWRVRGQLPRIRKIPAEDLGANYDTNWARRRASRITRATLLKAISKPFVNHYASPEIVIDPELHSVKTPVIFAANHASHIDTSLVITSLPRRFRRRTVVAAAADYFFDKQWKAALWALWFNVIPIEREKVGRKSTAMAGELLATNWNLVIFAEGTRSRDGSIAKFRGGAAYLSIRSEVPVVPVYLGGTDQIWKPSRKLPTRGKARIYFGTPLVPKESEKMREFSERIELAVRHLEAIDKEANPTKARRRWPI